MMSKLTAAVRKEYLLLVRDRAGLCILFLMPVILILVMTLIQDAAFKTMNEKGIPVVFVDNDRDTLGFLVGQGLRHNELCTYSDSVDGKPATAATAKQAVAQGKFLIGIVIPEGATAAIRKNVTVMVRESLALDTLQPMPNPAATDSAEIDILIYFRDKDEDHV
jgi:ABC-2 type transport system permease protein